MFSICQVKKIMESEYPNTKFRYIDMNFLPELCKRVSNRLITSKQNSGTFAMGLSFFLHQFRIDNQLIISIPENYNPEDLLDEDIDISGVYCGLMIENDANMVFYEGGMTDQFGFEEICRKILNVEHPFFLIFETKEYIEEIPEILKNITKYSIDTHLYFKIFNEEYNKLLNQNKIVKESKLFERLFKEIPDEIYHDILETTGNHVHGKLVATAMTKWVCNQYLKGNLNDIKNEQLYNYLISLRHGYSIYKHKLKPIMNYNSIQELEDSIMNIINSGYKSKSDLDRLAKKGSNTVYEDNNYLVLKINDYMAARKYGKNTRWCISSNLYSSTFDDYNENDDCYFIIDKKNNRKYACVSGKCWDEYDSVIFVVPNDEEALNELLSGYRGDADELYYGIKESPELYNILPLAFPNYSKEEIQNQIKKIIKEDGYELPINESFNREDIKKYNKLLKNYALRANKQLENGNKLSDELKNEILDFWKKRNKDYSNLTKMNIIYRCPPSISKKWIKKYKDMSVKYNPQN